MQTFFDSYLSEGLKMIRLFDYVDDLVFLMKVEDKGLSYHYINQAVKEILQFDKSSINRTLHEVIADQSEADLLSAQYLQVVASKEPVKFIHELVNPTRKFIGDTTLYPVSNEEGDCAYILAIVKDITEKYQLEQKLRENEERYRLIAENSLDVIKLINPEGIIEYVSPSSAVIVGLSPSDYLGNHFSDFLCEEDRDEVVLKFAEIVQHGKSLTVETKHLHADGHFIWMEIIATPVFKEGRVVQVVTSARDISERIEYREKLAKMAFHDYLSGLPNRRLFEDRLDMALKHASRHNERVGLILIDGRNFKAINDTYGHEVGDAVIVRLARRLEQSVRSVDTVARLGGDEFAIVLPELEDEKDATRVAERIVQIFEEPCVIGAHEIAFKVDIGISVYPDHTLDQKELIRFADEAMYSTKADDESSYCIYQAPIIL
ncbi:hypothetical protein CQS04_10060 [Chryseomicrobium excrementi]|uniref:Sensor domain-containing diguanylate cyclase n=1 Tax=Chryseomicrobium excrementi TaxID=2041346 RepID=A0A2M9EYF2_9BACL|nr:diguanylate cyclase [Chryseomicrobium excrementi]PJK16242.1 hypothetical protein CQS04_10060 [Chryseomicrobium excrementi]